MKYDDNDNNNNNSIECLNSIGDSNSTRNNKTNPEENIPVYLEN